MPTGFIRILRLAIPAAAIGMVVAIQAVYFNRGLIPGDAYIYYYAGQRLNASHQVYALLPSDHQIGYEPPFFTVPLLSPPPIAVLFRPLQRCRTSSASTSGGSSRSSCSPR